MSSGILVVTEARRGELRDVSYELIGAALGLREQFPGGVSVAVLGEDPASLADAASIAGVTEVLRVKLADPDFEPRSAALAVEALIADVDPALILLGHTVDSFGFAAAVAVDADTGFATDVTAVGFDGGPIATRAAYGGKLEAELEFPGREQVLLTLRPGAFETATERAEVPARDVSFNAADRTSSTHLGYREAAAGDVDITKADFLLSVGRGIGDQENLPKMEALADRLGATLGVSRPLVDAGWASPARQVGQSGKTVKPNVYLAFGISGAVQHLAGMQSAETIIAVNSDPQAPIFNLAHFGVEGDLFEVAEALERRLDERG